MNSSPVAPSNVIYSPSLIIRSPTENCPCFSFTVISPHPATQLLPIPLATTAAWDVIPPLAVKIPFAAFIPSISSGEVSVLTKITFFPSSAISLALSAVKTASPTAAPGEAGSPFAIASASCFATLSNWGCNNWSKAFGSTLNNACSFVINFSSTISTAILTAAAAVLFPVLVCRKNNLPSCIVNSISCMSL